MSSVHIRAVNTATPLDFSGSSAPRRRRRSCFDPRLVRDRGRGHGGADRAPHRARAHPDPRTRPPVVAGVPPGRADAGHRAGGPAALRGRRRHAGPDSRLRPSRSGRGEAAGRTARRRVASPFRGEPPCLSRLRRSGSRRPRHRVGPGPPRRTPVDGRAGPVPGLAQVIRRPPFRRPGGVRRQGARVPDPGGPGQPARARRTSAITPAPSSA